ncbi:MAG: glycosyltransferase family 2 protein [Vicinamibacterales bacterium]
MRASVIVVTYRRNRVLVDTVRALLPVLSSDDELIVVDQTDRHDTATSRFLASLADDPRIRVIRLRIASVPLARNVGIRIAKAPIVVFVDDDVLVAPGFIEAHVGHYHDPSVGAVAGHSFSTSGRPYFVATGRYASKLVGANMSFRRDVLFEIGGFDTNLFSTLREDGECGERLLRRRWRIANGASAALIHVAAVEGGAGGRERSDEWYRRTYHNYMYSLLKRSPLEIPVALARYAAGTFRYRFPGAKRFFRPDFLLRVFARGHVDGIRTRLFGDRGPYLTLSRPALSEVMTETERGDVC